ncbi:MAG: sigma-70 family RNA polymerase sigma factor [bacterium]|nr:sigma-70 family RNA polymerase sigma factor [bacterium]
MSPSMLVPLQKASRIIAQGDQDLSQDLLAMSFKNYQNTLQNHGKALTVAELTNFMKNRSKELKSCKRYSFGHGRKMAKYCVFNKLNYYSGEVEIHHIHHEDDAGNSEDPNDGCGTINSFLATKNLFDYVAFKITFEEFIKTLPLFDRQVLQLRIAGYNYTELARLLKSSYTTIRNSLKNTALSFIKYSELPQAYLIQFGLLN